MSASTTVDEATAALQDLATSLGMSGEAMHAFVENVDKAAKKMTENPREELRYRLNAQLLGEDPGKPVNWRGL